MSWVMSWWLHFLKLTNCSVSTSSRFLLLLFFSHLLLLRRLCQALQTRYTWWWVVQSFVFIWKTTYMCLSALMDVTFPYLALSHLSPLLKDPPLKVYPLHWFLHKLLVTWSHSHFYFNSQLRPRATIFTWTTGVQYRHISTDIRRQ